MGELASNLTTQPTHSSDVHSLRFVRKVPGGRLVGFAY